jgi:hypothetical protein
VVASVNGAKGIGGSYATVFAFGQLSSVTAVEDPVPGGLPTVLALRSWPNPFAGRTSLSLALPQSGRTTVRIYDLAGRLVRTVLDEVRPAGVVNAQWDGRDDAGASTAAGVYMARLEVGEQVVSRKLLRLE